MRFQHNILRISCIFLCCSCGILKTKNIKKLTESIAKENKLNSHNTTAAGKQARGILIITDSSKHQYHTEIVPVGEFTYSNKNGFKGYASSLKMSGELINQKKLQDSIQVMTRLLTEAENFIYQKENIKKSTDKFKKNTQQRPIVWVWLIAIALLFLFVYRLMRKFLF